ncbi:MAG TPA: DUF1800 family protein, partial [Pyrinomonadaceae bacterium]|nr:DUF1800 family protein [Pyrinomonadaceae bacterium]
MRFARSKNFLNQTVRQSFATLALTAMFTLPFTATAQKMNQPTGKKSAVEIKKLTEEQKILHVLNRLGFGARPGDVEKVRQIGLEKYIEQQLGPEKINDSAAEARVKNLEVLRLSNAELFAKYPNANAVVQIAARESGVNANQLKGDLKTARKEKKNETGAMAMKPDAQPNAQPVNPANWSEDERREYQRRISEIYRENDLRRPQQITQQLNASRILRAV